MLTAVRMKRSNRQNKRYEDDRQMTLKQIVFPEEKRKLPYDKVFKNIFRVIHILLFGVIFGGCFFNIRYDNNYNIVIVISGLLMMLRENYKNGIWLVQTRGILTAVKICILALIIISKENPFYTVLIVSLLGILSSHLPKTIRKYSLIKIS